MEFVRMKLSNGVNVILAPRAGSSAVSLQVWVFGGSRMETDFKANLAHLTEHMVLLTGGRDFPDSMSMEREARLLGGRNNGITSDEYVCYWVDTSPVFLKRAMHLLSDMVVHARLHPKDLDNEKEVVVKELNGALDDPEDYSAIKFKELIFGAHPLGRVDCEKIDILRSLTIDDVRTHKDFYYGSPNVLITVSGAMEFADTADLLELYFGKLPAVMKASPNAFIPASLLPASKVINKSDINQAHLYVGGLGVTAKDLDLKVCEVLQEILSYRLWNKIRIGKTLAYDVSAGLSLFSDAGYFVVHAGVDPTKKAVTETLRIVFDEMADIISGNISDDELGVAKSLIHVRMDLELESPRMVGCFLALNELCGRGAVSPDKFHGEVYAVNKSDVVLMAKGMWEEENVRSLLLTSSFKEYEEAYTKLRRVLER